MNAARGCAWLTASWGTKSWQRLEQVAILLLTTESNLTTLAQHVGWQDTTHLVRRFRSYAGQILGVYRRLLPVDPVKVLSDDWIQW